MGKDTKIAWCRHTFNPWVGCTKVSAACDHCYAESWAKRSGHAGLWAGERRRTSVDNWKQPIKWDKAAAATGERHRVFCASLADVFDNQVPEEWRIDLWKLINSTPNLDWLILTKRPQNIAKMMPSAAINPHPWFPNVWLGVTAENQEEYNRRWDHLRRIPAVVRFISYEPALGPITRLQLQPCEAVPSWVICGGESGGSARCAEEFPGWARAMRDQCASWVNIAFFMKQMVRLAPIPDDLMIRQFPVPS